MTRPEAELVLFEAVGEAAAWDPVDEPDDDDEEAEPDDEAPVGVPLGAALLELAEAVGAALPEAGSTVPLTTAKGTSEGLGGFWIRITSVYDSIAGFWTEVARIVSKEGKGIPVSFVLVNVQRQLWHLQLPLFQLLGTVKTKPPQVVPGTATPYPCPASQLFDTAGALATLYAS